MKITLILAGALLLSMKASGQPCVRTAREVGPVLSDSTRAEYERKLSEAEDVHLEKPNEADSIIWLARRKAYVGNYKHAVWLLTSGMKLHPGDARFYRHRGHRYITLRCFDDAVRDLEVAAKLIKDRPDQIEPDGLPNARNIPTSTLQSNIWYHLGLAYYLKGDFERADRAYAEAEKVSKNSDMRVAAAYWHYMTLRRSGKTNKAVRLLKPFSGNVEVIENADYLKLIKLNLAEVTVESLLSDAGSEANTLGSASLGYGMGNYYFYNGNKEKALAIFRKIVSGNQWASFGYIAAEQELRR